MNFQTYLEILHFLDNNKFSQEEQRAFGLQTQKLQNDPLKQILLWFKQNRQKYPLIKNYLHYTHYLTLLLGGISFILGVTFSTVLLKYSGNEPVNIIYFLTFAVFIPMLATLFSLFAMKGDSLLSHISFFYLLQKILQKFLYKKNLKLVQIDKNVEEHFLLLQLQLAGFLFSVGIFIGLIFLVSTQDIAFAWSTTLNITPKEMASFLSSFSFAFHSICPSTHISLELIEKSHYFRLGTHIDPTMLQSAASLGSWWKFLACSTLFYNVGPRLFTLIISYYSYKKTLKESLLQTQSVSKLLYAFNQPVIETHAQDIEVHKENSSKKTVTTPKNISKTFQRAFGWSLSKEKILVLSDLFDLHWQEAYGVGGSLSLEAEEQLIQHTTGDVLLFIPVWEIPTMEFIDFLDALENVCKSITLYPVGLEVDNYKANEKDLAIWKRKIALQNYKKVNIL